MSGPKAQAVQITEDERQALVKLIRAHKSPQRLVFRARIILGLAQGTPVKVLAQALQTRRGTIQDWRTHWLSRSTLPVEQRLEDGPRSGAPATFTPEQWCQILALACEPPELSGRPITHWTPRELAEEAIQRRIVPQISPRHLARFLKRSRSEAPSKPVLAQSRARPGRAE
jgi:putative transposase